MTKPPKAAIAKWVRALRSGEYRQGIGKLEGADGYCCLGILCELTIPKGKRSFTQSGYLIGAMPLYQPNAPQWAYDINNDFYSYYGRELTQLNDGADCRQHSFDEIADLIQLAYLENAFD